jgi:hypothetical protein
MNTAVITQSGAPDPAANEPRMVTLQNGTNAKVRNFTVMEKLLELQRDVTADLSSGDVFTARDAHRWNLIIEAVLGHFDHPVAGHIDTLESTGEAANVQTREQMLLTEMAKLQADNAKLRASAPALPKPTHAPATDAGTVVRPKPVGDVTDLDAEGSDAKA